MPDEAQPLPSPGHPAPDFALPDADGTVHRLKDFAGAPLVLFFYPRADTPSCTREAQDFTARRDDFRRAGCAIIGISGDPPEKLGRFAEKHGIDVTLLSDETGETLRAYGVWGKKSMYGRTFEGILRTTFLIGRDGLVRKSWRVSKVAGHAETVLEDARKIP